MAACRLRFRVFNLELGEGLPESYANGMDQDAYDAVCEHLLVEEKATGRVVGTYRMQSGVTAWRHRGYYSAQEFDFGPYEALRPHLLELGRACIDRDHRSAEVLTLLWRGIAQYADHHGLRYLIGCSSVPSQDAATGWAMYHRLAPFLAAPSLRTQPAADYRLPAPPIDTCSSGDERAEAVEDVSCRGRAHLQRACVGSRVWDDRFSDAAGYARVDSGGAEPIPVQAMSKVQTMSPLRWRNLSRSAMRTAMLGAGLVEVAASFGGRRMRSGARALTPRERADWLQDAASTVLRRIGMEVVADGDPPPHGRWSRTT